MPSRRQLLAGIGSTASATLAGCTTDSSGGASADELTEKWRTAVGPASAQAVVSGETLFVPVHSDILALNRETGERQWTVNAVTNPGDRLNYDSTPAADDYALYVAGGDNVVRALDIDDQSVWWAFEMEAQSYAAPGLAGSSLYVAGGEYVYELDADTGEVEWSRRLFGEIAGLAREWDQLAVTTLSGEVYSLDTDDGTGKWRVSLPDTVECAPLVHEQLVFVGCWDGVVYCFDSHGREVWSTDAGLAHGLAADDERIYVNGTTETHGIRRNSGDKRWSVERGDDFDTGISAPAVSDEAVYVGGDALHAVEPSGGAGIGDVRFGGTRFEQSLGGVVGHVSLDPDGDTLYAGVQPARGTYEYVALEVESQ